MSLSESLKVGTIKIQEMGVTTSVDIGDFQSMLSNRSQVQWERRNHKACRNGARGVMDFNTLSNHMNKIQVT